MLSLDFLDAFDQKLARLHGRPATLRSKDFVIPSQTKNALVVSESEGQVDVAILLKESLLRDFEHFSLDSSPEFSRLANLTILIEELSHFKTYCDHAARNLELSPLSLEIQAEIDKFAFVLDCFEEENYQALRFRVFEELFGELKLGDWVKSEEIHRYEEAHRIAKNQCQILLKECQSLSTLIESVRDFSHRHFQEKLRLRT